MKIELARPADMDGIMSVFECARRFMRSVGNLTQWSDGYPSRELMQEEIRAGHCYVCRNGENRLVATFCFIPGPDPTYAVIHEGAWPGDAPYWVIHRMASDGSCPGVARQCLDWCFAQHPVIRVDTHRDNAPMLHILQSYGFSRCGIIYVRNGTPRIAFQMAKSPQTT